MHRVSPRPGSLRGDKPGFDIKPGSKVQIQNPTTVCSSQEEVFGLGWIGIGLGSLNELPNIRFYKLYNLHLHLHCIVCKSQGLTLLTASLVSSISAVNTDHSGAEFQ